MNKNLFVLIMTLSLLIPVISCSKAGTPAAPENATASPTDEIKIEDTYTATLTCTATAVQTGTESPSSTASDTMTVTPSQTPTRTSSPSPTFTISTTHTDTGTPTDTATGTHTATVTETNTQTMTFTITNTPAVTLTVEALRTAVEAMPYTEVLPVPGGTFTQSDGLNSFIHTVSGFKCGKYEVTYELWHTVYEWAITNGFTFSNAGTEGKNGIPGAGPTTAKYEPVTTMDWRDAMVWCNAYSLVMGLTPVYYSDAGMTAPIYEAYTGMYYASGDLTPGSFDNPFVKWNADGYRLLTEGEWQCAASYMDGASWTPATYASGATASFYTVSASEAVAWFATNSGDITHEPGGRAGNALGIYDMCGNVEEWCWDWYGAYPGAPTIDYRGAVNAVNRIVRGGAYNSPANVTIVGGRNMWKSYNEYPNVGFRIGKSL